MAAQRSIVDKVTNLFRTKTSAQAVTSVSPKSERKGAGAIPRTTANQIIATHKVRDTDTLSGIALKYYGSAVRDYWIVIYEFNKTVIGDDPGVICPGTELRIPELPVALPMKRKG